MDLTCFHNPLIEERAFVLLKSIVEENHGLLNLKGDRLTVNTTRGRRYTIDLATAKVYDDSGKFICVRVVTPNLPIIDQVIAKSLHLLTYPEPLLKMDHDLLFKLTFVGSEPRVEWPWIRSMSYSTLGETFSGLIGADFAVKGITVGDLKVKLQMWYVNYEDRFRSIRLKHVRGSMGGVVVCTDTGHSENARAFQTNIDELRSCNIRDIPIMFVGLYDESGLHSRDGETIKAAEAVAKDNGIPFFRCCIEHPSTTRGPLTYLVGKILGRQVARRAMSS